MQRLLALTGGKDRIVGLTVWGSYGSCELRVKYSELIVEITQNISREGTSQPILL